LNVRGRRTTNCCTLVAAGQCSYLNSFNKKKQ